MASLKGREIQSVAVYNARAFDSSNTHLRNLMVLSLSRNKDTINSEFG